MASAQARHLRPDKQHQHYKRDPGFVIVQIQAHFHFRPDWYHQGEACALVKQYYVVLRSLLRSRPDLRRYLRRCRQRRIFFLTDPRNTGRSDLRCPFGCRQAHRKRRSTERSVAYYATAEGKAKKKIQNGKRAQGGEPGDANPPVPEAPGISCRHRGLCGDGGQSDRGSAGGEAEIVQMLARAMRQHSMARRRRIDYVVAQLHKHVRRAEMTRSVELSALDLRYESYRMRNPAAAGHGWRAGTNGNAR